MGAWRAAKNVAAVERPTKADRRPAEEVEHHDFDLFNTPEVNPDEPHDPAEIANLRGLAGLRALFQG
jgi:hypothetical protein